VNRRLAILPLVAMAALGLAACSSTTTGQGTPVTTPGQGGSTGAPSSSGSSGGGSSPLASLQPCDLLSSSVLTQFGLTRSSSITIPAARPCNWSKSVDINGENGYAVEIDIRDSQGIKDINSANDTVTEDNVGSHDGRELQATAGGSCTVVIGVSDSSRVDVGVTAGTDTSQACSVANQLAKVVEPQLPAGS
jgi:predicted small secreted protein